MLCEFCRVDMSSFTNMDKYFHFLRHYKVSLLEIIISDGYSMFDAIIAGVVWRISREAVSSNQSWKRSAFEACEENAKPDTSLQNIVFF